MIVAKGFSMLGRISILVLVVIASTMGLSTPAMAKESEAELLLPLGPWQLDMGEHKCRLARLFGADAGKTVFILDQWNPSVSAHWAVAGPGVRKIRTNQETSFAFGPDGDADEFRFTGGTLGDYGAVVTGKSTVAAHAHPLPGEEGYDWAANPRAIHAMDSAKSAEIETLTISQRGSQTLALRLGSMEKPLAALNYCMENLVESWGFDLEEQRTIATPPTIINLAEVAARIQREYPREALRKGAQADFHMRLTVGVDGDVKECALIDQTLAKGFDMRRHPCTIFKSDAEIEPARKLDGTPVETYYTTRVIYRMRGNAP